MVHLDVEDCSEKLLRQHNYAIKNQLLASKALKPQRGASKKPLIGGCGCDVLVLYGIRVLAPATLSTNESRASLNLDQ